MTNKPIKENKPKEMGVCEDCGTILPNRKVEVREGGYSEFITECPECGAVYTD